MRLANRKARFDREAGLSALESFANIGETPEDWKRFRLKWPDFFPNNLTEWFYRQAESWVSWSQYAPSLKTRQKTPLLFYRDCLRKVWNGNDHEGVFLRVLLGFELEVRNKEVLNIDSLFIPVGCWEKDGERILTSLIPGQSLDPDKQTSIAGLPPGRAIVNGVTGAITWGFGCTLQQSVYELMQQRWRAMVCPECRKFFLADKTRQVYCSSACFGEMKRKRALNYWNRKGSADRDKRRGQKRAAKTHGRSK
jgi:hypothetical protein